MKRPRRTSDSTDAVITLVDVMTGKRDTGYYSGMAVISADVNESTVVDRREIEVAVTFDGTNYATICIFWEEYGLKKYKTLGLYGQMNTRYQEVCFVPPRGLKIQSETYTILLQYKPIEI